MKLELLEGLEIKGPKINLLFYSPDNGSMQAQFWIPNAGEEVITELPIKTWNNAVSALCTFLEVYGEPRKSIMNKVNKIIDGITKKDLVVSE